MQARAWKSLAVSRAFAAAARLHARQSAYILPFLRQGPDRY